MRFWPYSRLVVSHGHSRRQGRSAQLAVSTCALRDSAPHFSHDDRMAFRALRRCRACCRFHSGRLLGRWAPSRRLLGESSDGLASSSPPCRWPSQNPRTKPLKTKASTEQASNTQCSRLTHAPPRLGRQPRLRYPHVTIYETNCGLPSRSDPRSSPPPLADWTLTRCATARLPHAVMRADSRAASSASRPDAACDWPLSAHCPQLVRARLR